MEDIGNLDVPAPARIETEEKSPQAVEAVGGRSFALLETVRRSRSGLEAVSCGRGGACRRGFALGRPGAAPESSGGRPGRPAGVPLWLLLVEVLDLPGPAKAER